MPWLVNALVTRPVKPNVHAYPLLQWVPLYGDPIPSGGRCVKIIATFTYSPTIVVEVSHGYSKGRSQRVLFFAKKKGQLVPLI